MGLHILDKNNQSVFCLQVAKMLNVKKSFKKGDYLWSTSCQNGVNFKPVIFVRYVRGDNAMVDIINSSGELSRESAQVKNLAFCTSEASDIKIKDKELKKAVTKAQAMMKKNGQSTPKVKSEPKVKLEMKNMLKYPMLRLERATLPNEFSELKKEADSNEDLEVSFKEPSVKPVKENETTTEENETPKIRRATKRTRSPGSRTKKSTTPISKVEKPVKEKVEEKEPENLDSDDDDS